MSRPRNRSHVFVAAPFPADNYPLGSETAYSLETKHVTRLVPDTTDEPQDRHSLRI
jgi:hypothetical protein